MRSSEAVARTDAPLGELFGQLSEQVSALVRQEIELARTEMTAKAARAGRNGALIGAGGALAYAGLLTLIAGLTVLLGDAIDNLWLAALIVGVAVLAIGGLLIQRGRSGLQNEDLAPSRTMRTLKADAQWVRERTT